jgi:hypothetical protein
MGKRPRLPRACVSASWLLLTFLALGLTPTGCGSSDNGVASKSAAEILTSARAAAQSASSVRLSTRSTKGRVKVMLDAGLARDRGSARTSFLGATFEVIRIGNTYYVKGNRLFDAQLERIVGREVPHGRWLKESATGRLAQLGSIVNLKTELPIVLGGQGAVSKGSTTKIKGQPAIELKQEHKLYTATLYVATTGEPYPLLLRRSGQETGETKFTGWNEPVTVTRPANAIDVSQLQHTKKH